MMLAFAFAVVLALGALLGASSVGGASEPSSSSGKPSVGVDGAGNLHINTTTAGSNLTEPLSVFLNGVDVLGEIDSLALRVASQAEATRQVENTARAQEQALLSQQRSLSELASSIIPATTTTTTTPTACLAVSFSEIHPIATDAGSANLAIAADIDGDGDADVLSAHARSATIAWYENTNGAGNFSAPKAIATNADGASLVHAADLDGDGDLDVLIGSSTYNKVAWYENTDGAGTFSQEMVITTSAFSVRSVTTADVDGDGDLDVLSASSTDNKIAWYENTDGAGTFSQQKVIVSNAGSPSSVAAADLDNDGDVDLMCTSPDVGRILWFENLDGAGTFSTNTKLVATGVDDVWRVFAADLDRDGNVDVLSASPGDDTVAWYRNNGGPTFSPQRIISSELDYPLFVVAADMDGDGDLDVLSASVNDRKVAWFENTNGVGAFSSVENLVTSGEFIPNSAVAADLDGDGDLDVLISSYGTPSLAWFENECS